MLFLYLVEEFSETFSEYIPVVCQTVLASGDFLVEESPSVPAGRENVHLCLYPFIQKAVVVQKAAFRVDHLVVLAQGDECPWCVLTYLVLQ